MKILHTSFTFLLAGDGSLAGATARRHIILDKKGVGSSRLPCSPKVFVGALTAVDWFHQDIPNLWIEDAIKINIDYDDNELILYYEWILALLKMNAETNSR